MKINEIISAGVISEAKLRKGVVLATPNLATWPELDNNNSPYAAYRFGIALAGSPEEDMDKKGPIGGQFTTIGYSSADEEILDAAAKEMGVTRHRESTEGSKELPKVNKTSPIAPRKKNKYGV